MDWRPLFCGLCFGIYPILAARSKLDPGTSFLAFGIIGFAFSLSLFAQHGVTAIRAAAPWQIAFIVMSYLCSAIGLLWMFRYLHDAKPEHQGSLVVIMVIAQVIVTWITALLFDKKLPTQNQIVGVVLAALAIFFLKK